MLENTGFTDLVLFFDLLDWLRFEDGAEQKLKINIS